jgi:hypothetical protein
MCSRGKQDFQRRRNFLAALDHVRQYLKSYRFHLAHGLFLARAIGHYPWKVRHGSQYSTVLLSFEFDADWLNLDHGQTIL